MATYVINPYEDTEPQIDNLLNKMTRGDEIEITEEIDFQSALADVEEGRYENIEEALQDKFLGQGIPYGAYFEFKEVVTPTSLVIRYITGAEGLQY